VKTPIPISNAGRRFSGREAPRWQAGNRRSLASQAFSLVEILVTVALLTFIMLGLLAMFQQTQRAFRTSMTQTDVLESGRAATDMIARELGQMTSFRGATNVNFYVQLSSSFNQPLTQGIPGSYNANGSQMLRSNIVQNFYFLTQNNLDWIGTGYAVVPLYGKAGVGTLYRFVTNGPKSAVWAHSLAFQRTVQAALLNPTNFISQPNFQRLADGVVHSRIRFFAPNGYPILPDRRTPSERRFPRGMYRLTGTNSAPLFNSLNNPVFGNVSDTIVVESGVPDSVDCLFTNRAVPACVEFELGILEPPVLDRYKSIGNATPGQQALQRQFLSNHVAQVHLFRQRVPIRNVDLNAYP
jgi:type II secretory pathway pseudopilin PulG